jgi:hypothetical protein
VTVAERNNTDALFLIIVWCFAALFGWLSFEGSVSREEKRVFVKPEPSVRRVTAPLSETPDVQKRTAPSVSRPANEAAPSENGAPADFIPEKKAEAPVVPASGFGKPRELDSRKIRDLIRNGRLSGREARFYEKK